MAESLIDITIEYWAKNSPMILDELKMDQGQDWVVTSVPLHPVRQRWRGFNQSELLGKIFAQKLGLRYENLLKRIRNTTPQMKLAAEQRRKNIKNAFEVINKESVANKILLFDDVWTTGSTLKECCYELKRAGASRVWALTIAR